MKNVTSICRQNGFYYWMLANGRYASAKKSDWLAAGGCEGASEVLFVERPPQEPDDFQFITMLLEEQAKRQRRSK